MKIAEHRKVYTIAQMFLIVRSVEPPLRDSYVCYAVALDLDSVACNLFKDRENLRTHFFFQ